MFKSTIVITATHNLLEFSILPGSDTLLWFNYNQLADARQCAPIDLPATFVDLTTRLHTFNFYSSTAYLDKQIIYFIFSICARIGSRETITHSFSCSDANNSL